MSAEAQREPLAHVARPRCPFCHEDVRFDEAKAACHACMAWHHEACWRETNERCSACRHSSRGPIGTAMRPAALVGVRTGPPPVASEVLASIVAFVIVAPFIAVTAFLGAAAGGVVGQALHLDGGTLGPVVLGLFVGLVGGGLTVFATFDRLVKRRR